MNELTDRDLELAAIALHSAAQSCQSGASLRNQKGLDPLAREYLEAMDRIEKLQAKRNRPLCGDIWDKEEGRYAHIVCGRRLNANGKHTGKHTYYNEAGKRLLSWWGEKP